MTGPQQGLPVPYPGLPAPAPGMVAILPDGRPLPRTARVDPIPGSPFGVALMRPPTTPSGPAIGSLVSGIASILVSLVTACLGLSTAEGVAIGGAFAILATAFGAGAIELGLLGLRQVRRGAGRVTGRGMGIAGIVCGACGVLFSGAAILGAVAISTGG